MCIRDSSKAEKAVDTLHLRTVNLQQEFEEVKKHLTTADLPVRQTHLQEAKQAIADLPGMRHGMEEIRNRTLNVDQKLTSDIEHLAKQLQEKFQQIENFDERVISIFGHQKNTRSPSYLNPAFCLVIPRVSIIWR